MSPHDPSPPPHLLAIGDRIRARRERLQLSQAALATRMGIASPMVISRYENGQRDMRVTTALALSQALEMPIGELLVGPSPWTGPGQTDPSLVAEPDNIAYTADLGAALQRIQMAEPEAFNSLAVLIGRLDPDRRGP